MRLALVSASLLSGRSRRLLAVAAIVGCAGAARANTFIGGPWNVSSSWSDGFVPDSGTDVEFTGGGTGDVQINGGAFAQSIHFGSEADNYHLISEPTGILTVRQIDNANEHGNSIDTAFIRGVNVDPEHGVLDINSGSTWFGGLDRLTVSAAIVNAQDIDNPTAGPAATDLYANATFTGLMYQSGKTTLFGSTRLAGNNGRIVSSQDVTLARGSVIFDSSDGRSADRIPNGAVVHLDGGELVLKGDASENVIDEKIGSLVVGAGVNGVSIQDNARLTLTNAFNGLSRDNVARGTFVLSGEDQLKLSPAATVAGGVVPYAVIQSNNGYLLPVQYDKGADNTAGTADDGGLVPVATTDLTTALASGEHVLINSSTTLATANHTVGSLTFNGGDLDVGVNALTLASGVIVVNDFTPGSPVIHGGASISPGPGLETIIHNHADMTDFAGHFAGGNGLTITNFNDSGGFLGSGKTVILSGSNSYSGQTTINNGAVIFRNAQAIPGGSDLRLTDCNVNFDYAPTTALTGRVIFDGDATSLSARDNFLRDFRIQDNRTLTVTGGFEGRGAYFLEGANATLLVNTPAGTTASAASTGQSFSIWPNEATVTLRVDGVLGDPVNSPGAVIQFNGATTGKGRISGGMQLSGGVLAPGSDGAAGTAVLRMNDLGYYGGAAHFNINGTTRGTQYDGLDVDTSVTLSSDASIVIESGGVTGHVGNRFELMHYASHYLFSTPPTLVNPLAVQPGAQWIQVYGATAYTLAVAGPTGDASLDGRVGFDDLLTLAKHYNGTDQTWFDGDFTGDGVVAFADLLELAKHYGQAVPGLSSPAAGDVGELSASFASEWTLAQSLVPEPTTLAALLGIVPFAARRRAAN